MILYEVKLICVETEKVIFTSLNKRPELPPKELLEQDPKPLLVISTKDSNSLKDSKKSA